MNLHVLDLSYGFRVIGHPAGRVPAHGVPQAAGLISSGLPGCLEQILCSLLDKWLIIPG